MNDDPLADRTRRVAGEQRGGRRRRRVDDPHRIWLNDFGAHHPVDEIADRSERVIREGDMLMQIDSYLGELLDTIDDLGVRDNTIVIFTADNGPEALSAGETSMTVETALHGSAGPWRSTLFTGYEGALRVPFAVRWPDRIAAGRVSDEIVHEMDLFPTLAKVAGGSVPDDRVIDGIDISGFLVGDKEKSGREGFIVYMGNDVFGVKWNDWKLHFKEQTGWNGVLREYTMPRLYNLISDPQERDNVLFPHTWVPKAALPQLEQHVVSLKRHPPIAPGTPDPYKPAD